MKDRLLALLDSFDIGESLVTASADKIGKSSLIRDVGGKIAEFLNSSKPLVEAMQEVKKSSKIDLKPGLESLLLAVVLLNALYNQLVEKQKEDAARMKKQAVQHHLVDLWAELLMVRSSTASFCEDLNNAAKLGGTLAAKFNARFDALKSSAMSLEKRLGAAAGELLGYSHVCGLLDKVRSLLAACQSEDLEKAVRAHLASLA